jgi:hypothetical protein
MSVKPTEIPSFIFASTPLGLKKKMLKNNLKYGYFLQYFDISFVNGRWYAWFYVDVDLEMQKQYLDKED